MPQAIKKLLLETLDKYPDNPAFSIGSEEYNYHYFLEPVVTLVELLNKSLKSQQALAVLADKSLLGYQCIASVFIAEKVYVPLNLQYPLERNAEILRQSGIQTIMVDSSCEAQAQALYHYLDKSISLIIISTAKNGAITHSIVSAVEHAITDVVLPPTTSYLLFTSGSTGKPKGVAISDENIESYIDNILRSYHFLPEDRFSQFFDFTFDLSLHDMLICWKVGACLCPADKSALLLPLHFAKQQAINIWFSVPSLALIAKDLMRHRFDNFRLESIRHSFFCGEALPVQLAKAWQQITSNAPVTNLYGPTEATIAITAYDCPLNMPPDQSVVQIGLPFGGNKCKIFHTDGRPCSIAEQGELCLSGKQVFKSYLNQPDLTKAAFHIEQSSAAESIYWYRTGDIASQCEKENITYHGRNDRQVQVKGFRVELQEVEHTLRKMTSAGTLAVIAFPLSDIGEALGLTAFITEGEYNDEVLNECKQKLPHYMIPDNLISLEQFPYNASGKLDYKQLLQIAKQ